VRVGEAGRHLDLAKEPLGADFGRHFGAQDLDCHMPVVARVVREVHDGHASGA
jgi:hypothetical protein